MTKFVYRDGSRLTPHMAYQIDRLSSDFKKVFGYEIVVTSAIRLDYEQIAIFLERYVTAANINGRRVYDTRVWRGTRYYRISDEGTVAVPSTSNHEIQGNKAAVDIKDTGPDAGVTVANSERGRWIRRNAYKYGLVASGDGFDEGWHFDTLDIYAEVPTSGIPTKPKPVPPPEEEEDDMAKNSGVWYKTDQKTYVYLVFNTVSGFAQEFSNGKNAGTMEGVYTAGLKAAMDISGWSEVTAGHAAAIKNSLAAVRPKTGPSEISVTIIDPDELKTVTN